MTFNKIVALVAILTLSGDLAAAEQAPDASNSPREQSQQDDGKSDSSDKPTSTTNSNDRKNKDTEVFRPSEEISEDFAVSFPVDI